MVNNSMTAHLYKLTLLGHKENLSESLRMEIVQTTSSAHNTTRVVTLVIK